MKINDNIMLENVDGTVMLGVRNRRETDETWEVSALTFEELLILKNAVKQELNRVYGTEL